MLHGVSLERNKSAYYFVVRHNVRTYRSEGVVEVVKGSTEAGKRVKQWEECQSSADYHEGWRYFCEESNLSRAVDPTEATRLRQTRLENRESKHYKE